MDSEVDNRQAGMSVLGIGLRFIVDVNLKAPRGRKKADERQGNRIETVAKPEAMLKKGSRGMRLGDDSPLVFVVQCHSPTNARSLLGSADGEEGPTIADARSQRRITFGGDLFEEGKP